MTILLLLLLAEACGQGGQGGQGGETTEEVEQGSQGVSTQEDAEDAVVYIRSVGGLYDQMAAGSAVLPYGNGTGFIIDPSGLAITNNHVVAGSGYLEGYLSGEGEALRAEVLGVAECSDLALIDLEGDGYQYFDWYEGEIRNALDVRAIGFPADDLRMGQSPDITTTTGIINSVRADGVTPFASISPVLEHQAVLRGGNSGGPLVDENLRVVGVNFMGGFDPETGPQSARQFAIPRDEALEIIDDLHTGNVDSIGVNGEAKRLQFYDVVDNEEVLSITGIEVASVEPGSPAAKAGVKGYEYNSQGQLQRADVITELQNTFLATDATKLEYCNILSSNLRRQPDRALSMKVFRLEIGPEDDTWTELEGELNGTELRETDSVEVPTDAYGIRSV